jgi:cell cycle checkpoint protein
VSGCLVSALYSFGNQYGDRFNPIAPTLMKKGLNAILDAHFCGSTAGRPPKDIVELIVESSNGDIRSAIMALQFACVVDMSIDKKGKKKTTTSNRSARVVLESVTRREQSLVLFHLIGKVLYNKSGSIW